MIYNVLFLYFQFFQRFFEVLKYMPPLLPMCITIYTTFNSSISNIFAKSPVSLRRIKNTNFFANP